LFHLYLTTIHPTHGISHTFTCAQPQARPTQQIFFLTALHKRVIWSIISTLYRGGQHNIPVLSQIGTTHPSHGLSLRSVSWRMTHAVVIINTHSQLGRHSPSGQVSHRSTRTKRFGEDICDLLMGRKVMHVYCLPLHHVSDIVIFYLDVFRSIMKHRVLRELYTALVITMNSSRIHLMIK
jgi:hypothetical protein